MEIGNLLAIRLIVRLNLLGPYLYTLIHTHKNTKSTTVKTRSPDWWSRLVPRDDSNRVASVIDREAQLLIGELIPSVQSAVLFNRVMSCSAVAAGPAAQQLQTNIVTSSISPAPAPQSNPMFYNHPAGYAPSLACSQQLHPFQDLFHDENVAVDAIKVKKKYVLFNLIC